MKVCSVCQRCYEDDVNVCAQGEHGALTEKSDKTPESVEGYRLVRRLENRLNGEIYRAAHVPSQKEVLIIFLKTGTDENSIEKLQREVQAVFSLNHPNLARVFEFGRVTDREFYLVQESCAGETLHEYLQKRGRLPERDAILIARQAAEALEALHGAGVIHRGINPKNIIFTESENRNLSVKLQNFDFAGVREQAVVASANRVDAQTDALCYLSPEQIAGSEVESTTDIYSLGAVLYEMLSGELPYSAPNAPAILNYVFSDKPFETLRFDVRALLSHLLRESLHKRTNLRPPKAGSLARQLRHVESLVTPAPIAFRDFQASQIKSAAFATQSAAAQTAPPAAPRKLFTEREVIVAEPPVEELPVEETPVEILPVAEIAPPTVETAAEPEALPADSVTLDEAAETPAEILIQENALLIPTEKALLSEEDLSEDIPADEEIHAGEETFAGEEVLSREEHPAPDAEEIAEPEEEIFVPEIVAAVLLASEETEDEEAVTVLPVVEEAVLAESSNLTIVDETRFETIEPPERILTAPEARPEIFVENAPPENDFLEEAEADLIEYETIDIHKTFDEQENFETAYDEPCDDQTTDGPPTPETGKTVRRAPDNLINSFGAYSDNRQILPGGRMLYIGAGVCAFLVLTGLVFGYLSGEPAQVSSQQTVTSAPPAAPVRVEEPAVKPEEPLPPPPTITKTSVESDEPIKTSVALKENEAALKREKNPVENKVKRVSAEQVSKETISPKSQVKQSASKVEPAPAQKTKPQAPKSDGLTRPRIVSKGN